jgi:hypothetical protein
MTNPTHASLQCPCSTAPDIHCDTSSIAGQLQATKLRCTTQCATRSSTFGEINKDCENLFQEETVKKAASTLCDGAEMDLRSKQPLPNHWNAMDAKTSCPVSDKLHGAGASKLSISLSFHGRKCECWNAHCAGWECSSGLNRERTMMKMKMKMLLMQRVSFGFVAKLC